MRIRKIFCQTIFFLFTALHCFGHRNRYIVDSTDAVTGERVRIVVLKVGDADYHKFGKVLIEQRRSRYFITFPLIQYRHVAQTSVDRKDEVIQKGTVMIIKCGARKVVQSETREDTHVLWHYLWYYRPFSLDGNDGLSDQFHGSNLIVYRLKNGFDPDMSPRYGLYGLNWQVRLEFTHDDMLLLSMRKITDAYITENGSKIYLPLKGRQAARMQKMIGEMVRSSRYRIR